jgi:hypothetical protein
MVDSGAECGEYLGSHYTQQIFYNHMKYRLL